MVEDQRTPDRKEGETGGEDGAQSRGGPAVHRLTGVLAGQADRVFLALVILVCVIALVEVSEREFGAISTPGPALWPTVVCVVTVGAAVLAMWLGRDVPEPIDRTSLGRVVGAVGALVVFVLLYDFVGFVPSGALALFLILRWVCREGWLTSALTAVLGSVCTYTVFGLALGVSLTGIGS